MSVEVHLVDWLLEIMFLVVADGIVGDRSASSVLDERLVEPLEDNRGCGSVSHERLDQLRQWRITGRRWRVHAVDDGL